MRIVQCIVHNVVRRKTRTVRISRFSHFWFRIAPIDVPRQIPHKKICAADTFS